jgi:NADH-quinone oxidoreductase subunit M
VILAAVYLLWSYQRIFFGRLENPDNKGLKDLSLREWAVLLPVIVFIVWIGVFPKTFLDKSALSVRQVVHQIEEARRGQTGTGEAIRTSFQEQAGR